MKHLFEDWVYQASDGFLGDPKTNRGNAELSAFHYPTIKHDKEHPHLLSPFTACRDEASGEDGRENLAPFGRTMYQITDPDYNNNFNLQFCSRSQVSVFRFQDYLCFTLTPCMKLHQNCVGSATVPTISRRARWPALHCQSFFFDLTGRFFGRRLG